MTSKPYIVVFVGNMGKRCLRTGAIFSLFFNVFDNKMFEIPEKTADSEQKRLLRFEKIKEKIKMFSGNNFISELIKLYKKLKMCPINKFNK